MRKPREWATFPLLSFLCGWALLENQQLKMKHQHSSIHQWMLTSLYRTPCHSLTSFTPSFLQLKKHSPVSEHLEPPDPRFCTKLRFTSCLRLHRPIRVCNGAAMSFNAREGADDGSMQTIVTTCVSSHSVCERVRLARRGLLWAPLLRTLTETGTKWLIWSK